MAAPFNISNKTFNTAVDLFRAGNDVTSTPGQHILGDLLVFTAFIVAFGALNSTKDFKPVKCIMAASFIAFVFAVFFDLLNLIDAIAITIPIAVFAISVVVDFVTRRE